MFWRVTTIVVLGPRCTLQDSTDNVCPGFAVLIPVVLLRMPSSIDGQDTVWVFSQGWGGYLQLRQPQ